jgi:hypothetical protein
MGSHIQQSDSWTDLCFLEMVHSVGEYNFLFGRCRFSAGSGHRKNRFMDIMNLILEEAPKHGLKVSYAHELLYARYHYDGSQ